MRVAVIGAGLAGLTCARILQEAGARVVVLEKSRGVGGRTATRRAGALTFDHGAPAVARGALGSGGIPWTPILRDGSDLEDHEVAAGAMTARARALAAGLDVRLRTRVAPLARPGVLHDEDGRDLGTFDRTVVAVPAPQAAALLEAAAPGLAARAAPVAFDPCWTAMAAWEQPLGVGWQAARDAGILAWAVAEAAKPGRAPGERWVLQAGAGWSAAHLEEEPEAVGPPLLAGFAELAGRPVPPPAHLALHRWRYAVPRESLDPSGPAPTEGGVVLAGDWCRGTDAVAAVASGQAAAAALA